MKQARTPIQIKQRAIRILIADDNPTARAGLQALLRSFRDKLAVQIAGEASNGAEVIEAVKRAEIGLVLMDASMPQINGIEATKQIKKFRPELKIIVLSVSPSFREPAGTAGADAFLLKGFTPDELYQMIMKVTIDVDTNSMSKVIR